MSENVPPSNYHVNILTMSLNYADFAITLVTRPVLISALTNCATRPSPQHQELASACVDAAVYLVQTCNDAFEADVLLGNMCILKALLFAVGLVLGFESFAKRQIDYRVETAFRSARTILNFLAIQSSQAAHYHEILALLAGAIEKQRGELLSKGRSTYVSRIFPISIAQDTSSSTTMTTDIPSTNFRAAAGVELDDREQGEGVANIISEGLDQHGDIFLGYDSLDLSQWDGFPFLDSLGPDT
ncbi:Nn.00g024690.m01.CDS01 [Neocucurbitaria sp. VM-36]